MLGRKGYGGLAVGVIVGLVVAGQPAPSLLARGSDRSGESIVVTGVISLFHNPATKTNIVQDGVFLLDYKTGRLLASIPDKRQVGREVQVLGPMAERDLVKDFHISPGGTPKFLMTTATLQEGWEPLMVFELTTGQVAVYRLNPQPASSQSPPVLELLERRPLAGAPTP